MYEENKDNGDKNPWIGADLFGNVGKLIESHGEDRVRALTAPEVLERIDSRTHDNVRFYASLGRDSISRRIEQLNDEWDIDRYLQLSVSSLALLGLMWGLAGNRTWRLLPWVVLPLALMYTTVGWCPPLSVLRKIGIRSRSEIDGEKYALKALRGDFKDVVLELDVEAAMQAANTVIARI